MPANPATLIECSECGEMVRRYGEASLCRSCFQELRRNGHANKCTCGLLSLLRDDARRLGLREDGELSVMIVANGVQHCVDLLVKVIDGRPLEVKRNKAKQEACCD